MKVYQKLDLAHEKEIKMNITEKYILPMFSSNLVNDPIIEIKGMQVSITISGYDDDENLSEVKFKFYSVIEFTKTSPVFGIINGSYDTLVEVQSSERLIELETINNREYSFRSPKHYALYLDGYGFFQIFAKKFEVERLV